MFSAMKDERLKLIQNEGAALAFGVNFIIVMGLMIARGFMDDGLLGDPDFILVVPWLVSTFVFVGFEIKRGLYTAIREENTRKPDKLLEARVRLVLSVVLFASIMFAFKRFDVFSDEVAPVTEDLIDTAIVTVLWAVTMWFMLVRKPRRKREE